MPKARRIIFSFDESSERQLIDLTKEGGFSSKARAVREAVALFRRLQEYHQQGYTELYVRNPTTENKLCVHFTPLELTANPDEE